MSRDVNIVVKLTYFQFDCLLCTQTHTIIMATMNILGSYYDCRVIGTCFDGLVFRTLYFWHWFSSFQLELARPKYINRKIETFERFLMLQKALVKFKHRKIVFVKVESSVTRNIWKRSLIQTLRRYKFNKGLEEIYWDPKKQSTKRLVNISFSNN